MQELLSSFKPEQFFIQVVALSLTALILPKLRVTSIFGPILTVLSLSAINVLYWDSELFSFVPQDFSTKILGILFVNGVLFWIIVKLLPGIEVDGVVTAVIAPILFSVLSVLVKNYGPLIPWNDIATTLLNLLNSLKQNFSSPVPDKTSFIQHIITSYA